MSTTALMALNPEWVQSNTTATVGGAGVSITGHMTYDCYPSQTLEYFPYPRWSYPVYVSSPSRPIKLTLREVERLRDAAQADPKLQRILAKFTDQIEVAVSFED